MFPFRYRMIIGRVWCQLAKFLIILSSLWSLTWLFWYQISPGYSPLEKKSTITLPSAKEIFNIHTATPLDVMREAEKTLNNLPVDFWNRNNMKVLKLNKTCAKFPSIFDIQYHNVNWQTLNTKNGTFFLLSAFYDIRKQNYYSPTVRILGMIDRVKPTVKTVCQFWFENETKPAFGRIFEYKYIWHPKWGNYHQGICQPYLISCSVPSSHKMMVPVAVSIVEKECETAKNLLRVIYNKVEKKKPFAVCVKGLDFLHTDMSLRLVEWIELLYILGADKIFIYELQTHPNISRILQYYERKGLVSVKQLTLPGSQPNAPFLQHLYLTRKYLHKRQNEVIPYNDCFYRNLYAYEFIALLDIDEVIMPVLNGTWHELFREIESLVPKKTSFCASNVYFLDDANHDHGWFADIPQHLHMLQHVYRARNFTKTGFYTKCFHSTNRILTLHNHFPFQCFGKCNHHTFSVLLAQLQHYRRDCVSALKKVCDNFRSNTIIDTTIWKFKDELIRRTTKALTEMS